MKRAYKTLSVLMAMLIAAAFIPWGGMKVGAEAAVARGYIGTKSQNGGQMIEGPTGIGADIMLYTDEQLGVSQNIQRYLGIYFTNTIRDPSAFWAPDNTVSIYDFTGEYEGVEYDHGINYKITHTDAAATHHTDPIVTITQGSDNTIDVIPKGYGSVTVTLLIQSSEVKRDDSTNYFASVSATFVVRKVIKKVDLQNWFMPADKEDEVTVSNAYPAIRTEGLGDGNDDPNSEYSKIAFHTKDNNNSIATCTSDDAGTKFKIRSVSPGIEVLYGIPEFDIQGNHNTVYKDNDNPGKCDIVVAKIKPEDKIIYVGQTDTLTEDEDETFPDAGERDSNSLSDITSAFSLAGSEDTTGTYINLSDDKQSATGKVVGYEPIKAVMTAGSSYYTPAGNTVEGSGTVCVVEPEFLIPPRVVNCDESVENTHDLYETGNAGEDVVYTKPAALPAGTPAGFSKTADDIPEVPVGAKGVKHTSASGGHTSIAADSAPGTVTGSSAGVDTITAQYAPTVNGTVVPRTDKTDSANAAVVRNLELSKEDTAGGDLGPKTSDLSDGHTIKYALQNSTDSAYITLTEDGHVTPVAVTPDRIPVNVTIERTVGTTVLKDTTVCYVTVKANPLLNIGGLTVRYTGLEKQNSLPISKDIFKYTKKDGSSASVDIGETLAASDWTPTKGISTFSKPNLKPNSGYDAVGNELLTAPASVDSYIVKDNKANLAVDIYGYEFLDNDSYKKHYDYTKGSKKDLKYKIDLKAPSSNDSTKSMVKTGEAIYNDEFEKVTVSDKNGTVLTKNGAKKGTDYDLKAGSVEIILHPAYLDTLEPGTYTLTGYFTPSAEQGNDVDTLNRATFTIKPPSTGVKTEDVTRVGGVTVLFGTSVAILLWLRKKRRGQVPAQASENPECTGGTGDIPRNDIAALSDDFAPGTDGDTGYAERGSVPAGRNDETAGSHGRFRKYDPFESDVRDSSQENARQRSDREDSGSERGQVKHLPPRRVDVDEDAREFDRRARRSSPDMRERMREERRAYYEYREYGSRRGEPRGYYPRRRGDVPPRGNNGRRRPY